MSHPFAYLPSQRSHARRNKYGNRVEGSQSENSHGEHHSAPRSRGPRHPPWLKGKEIGLFYRDEAIKKAKQKLQQVQPIIKLPSHLEASIEHIIEKSKGYYDTLYNNEAYKNFANSVLENKYVHIHDSQFKRKFLNIVSGNIQENLAKALLVKSGLERDSNIDVQLLNEYKAKQSSSEYETMMKCRLKLPSYKKRPEILQLLRDNQVVVISGETGCGKTTQVAQFILDDQIEQGNGSITKIICTQPRRISAISVAERVAAERAERLGRSVGFHIRLEKTLPRDRGSILFCTTGMLLQFIQGDPALKEFSHIILDEIHERSTDSDFVMAVLKLIIPKRPDLKVVLMSATLNSEIFSKYYNECPMIHIPGFTYPVEEFYLEDVLAFTRFEFPTPIGIPQDYKKRGKKYEQIQQSIEFYKFIEPHIRRLASEKRYSAQVIGQLRNPESEKLSINLIEELIRYICRTQPPGAILVFLPGMMDIVNLQKRMIESRQYPESQFVIYPLHSLLPTIEQKLIFSEPPDGIRKIIIATSIAETSITIEDVVYVINCGRTKFGKFDVKKNIQTLEPEWISLANAKQRRGRAGRVKPGYCYHLYTKAREMMFDQYPLPEMLRTQLEEVILRIKILQLGKARSFLDCVMDPPNCQAIDLSLDLLRTLNALDSDENLTPLGYHLAQLPVNPRIGKMIIWAALFSCVEPVFAIAASLSFKHAFYCPLRKEEEAKQKKLELSNGQYSDHIALAEALRRFENLYRRGNAGYFCRDYFLSFSTLKLLSEMKSQFVQHLYEMKFLDSANPRDASVNRNSDNITLVKSIVYACLYPNVAVVRDVTRNGTLAWTAEDGRVVIHPMSVNDKVQTLPSRFITYFTKQRSTAIFLHDTTCISGSTLIFATPNMRIEVEKGKHFITLPTLPNFETFRCDKRTAELIQELQRHFKNILEYKITHPGTVNWDSYEGNFLNLFIEVICQPDESIGLSTNNTSNS
ncbi:ATP-dependent DNA/RNA helicase DHX36 [Megachile rotundata]|uniref:ATP-dependent DNA/RNA helicase DHX36 n=1 Tax=Megachile rotundata TaxID=143995 RepID=UPI003FCFBD88